MELRDTKRDMKVYSFSRADLRVMFKQLKPDSNQLSISVTGLRPSTMTAMYEACIDKAFDNLITAHADPNTLPCQSKNSNKNLRMSMSLVYSA